MGRWGGGEVSDGSETPAQTLLTIGGLQLHLRASRPTGEPARKGRYAVGGPPCSGSRGGSIRSTVLTRSMDLSNEAIERTPVLSACATR